MIWYNQLQLLCVLLRENIMGKNVYKSYFFQQKVYGMDMVMIWYKQLQLLCVLLRENSMGQKVYKNRFFSAKSVWYGYCNDLV